jgi:hypothetical protein
MDTFEVYLTKAVLTKGTVYVTAASFAEAEKQALLADEEKFSWADADAETELEIHQITKD